MKFTTILAAVALPCLSSALTCYTNSACCGINYPNIPCPCKNDYPEGAPIYVECQCKDVVYNPNTGQSSTYYYYGDESGSWVNFDHLTDCDGVPEYCDSCTPGNCDSAPGLKQA